jgi:hypothetical protein
LMTFSFTLALAAALSACGGPPQGQLVEVQSTSAVRPVAPAESTPGSAPFAPLPTETRSTTFLPADTARLPAGAQPLQPGDYGVSDEGGGAVEGTIPADGMRCNGDSLLEIATDEGTFIAGVSRIGDWSCQSALDQWRSVSPTDSAIGLRYSDDSSGAFVLLVDDRGGSLSLRVDGAWRSA